MALKIILLVVFFGIMIGVGNRRGDNYIYILNTVHGVAV